MDYSADDWYDDNRCSYKTILYPQWRVYKLGPAPVRSRALYASSEPLRPDGPFSYEFFAASGLYQLEWDLPTAAPCLNPRHPRLTVFSDSAGYGKAVTLTQLFCLFLCGTGLSLTVAAARVARSKSARTLAPRIFPDMVVRHVMPIAKHRPLQIIHGLPHWGLFFGTTLWILMFIYMIEVPFPSKGLLISWKGRGSVASEKNPWPGTLEVYIHTPSRFFVNGEEVDRRDLQSKLIDQLGHRAEWTVYFEADANTAYMDSVYAMDVIQGCGAKLVWITPKMREQWQHTPNPPPKN